MRKITLGDGAKCRPPLNEWLWEDLRDVEWKVCHFVFCQFAQVATTLLSNSKATAKTNKLLIRAAPPACALSVINQSNLVHMLRSLRAVKCEPSHLCVVSAHGSRAAFRAPGVALVWVRVRVILHLIVPGLDVIRGRAVPNGRDRESLKNVVSEPDP